MNISHLLPLFLYIFLFIIYLYFQNTSLPVSKHAQNKMQTETGQNNTLSSAQAKVENIGLI